MSVSAALCFKGALEYGYTLINTIHDYHDDDPLELTTGNHVGILFLYGIHIIRLRISKL